MTVIRHDFEKQRRRLTSLDRICLEAKTAARHADLPIYRETAAREAVKLPGIDADSHGEAKLHLSLALRELMKALPYVASYVARDHLAKAIDHAADAARAEPDRPKLKSEVRPYWVDRD